VGGSENAVEADQGVAWGRNQGGETSEELGAGHDAMGAVVLPVLGAVAVAAVGQGREALEHDGRPSAIADETLAPQVIALCDPDPGVEVEAVVCANVASVGALGLEASLVPIGWLCRG
jgi:hypothetical protein